MGYRPLVYQYSGIDDPFLRFPLLLGYLPVCPTAFWKLAMTLCPADSWVWDAAR